jgi:hypothetical protein
MKNSVRSLDTIKGDIDVALRNRTASAVRLGGLLVEAKTKVKHGDFEDWISNNFVLSARTARRYMSAFELVERHGKTDKVSDLKIAAGALYAMESDEEGYTQAGIEAVLKAAETEWTDEGRAREIQNAVTEAERLAAKAEERDAEKTEEALAQH